MATRAEMGGCTEFSSVLFGRFVKSIWKEKVTTLMKGPNRDGHRVYYLVNIGVKQRNGENDTDLETKPNGSWNLIVEKSDILTEYVYLKTEDTYFRKQRERTELHVGVSALSAPTQPSFRLRRGDIDVDFLQEFQVGTILDDFNLSQKIDVILQFISMTKLCAGLRLEEEKDQLCTFLPHVIGEFRDGTDEVVTVARAVDCRILTNEERCKPCAKLRKIDNDKRRKKLGKVEVHPKANKRYMTQDEVQDQLKQTPKRSVV